MQQDDKNKDKDLPGYPHYPAKEDITNAANNNGKLPIGNQGKEDTPVRNEGTGANDITSDDIANLKQEDPNITASKLDNVDNEGVPLNEHNRGPIGNDLDIPGAELDDQDEAIGAEDEENNYYSLGDNDTTENTEGIP